MLRGVVLVAVHAEHDGDVGIRRGGGDDHLAGAGGEMLGGTVTAGEEAGLLEHDGNVELLEQPAHQRVSDPIEHHEAGVDRHGAPGARFGGVDGVAVSAYATILFKNRDRMLPVKKMGAAEAGDAGPDDSDSSHG